MRRTKKWLIYDATVLAASFIAAALLYKHVNTTPYSLMPLATIVLIALWAFGARKYENMERSIYSAKFSKRGGQRSFRLRPPSAFDTKWDRIEEFFYLIALPLPIPFALFFDDRVKMTAAGVFFCLPLVFPVVTFPIFIKEMIDLKNKVRQEREMRERELEEQKRREEMGEWK